ncbi:MAG: hypothetical protein IJI67_01650 [Clostridia bacterium]|nr:hypothetical protein [Clostridia bacterium]
MKDAIVRDIIYEFNQDAQNYTIFIVANTRNILKETKKWDYNHASMDEFFSREEFAEIASAIFSVFGYVKVFYSEMEFINFAINNSIEKEKTIVYNFSRDGIKEGKKSLIPAFCDLLGIKYTGSNAFVISLLRNKFTYSSFLNNFEIPIPKTYYYSKEKGFLTKKPDCKTVIIKSINESASIGMSEKNIITILNNSNWEESLIKISNNMQDERVMVQEYIPGLECEVLVLKVNNQYKALDPVLIKIKDSDIITSKISNAYDYEFDLLQNNVCKETCDSICEYAEKSAELLCIDTYARFDFRIDYNGNCFLIDIAGTPYTIKHSSISYIFKQYNLSYNDIYKVVVQLSKF